MIWLMQCVLMNDYEGNEIVNVGVGEDISIKDLAETIKKVIGFQVKSYLI